MFKPTTNASRDNTSGRGVTKRHIPHILGTAGFKKKMAHIVVPYIQRMSESFKKVCGKQGFKCALKEVRPSKASL